MRQQLWILNISLLVIFLAALLLGTILKQTPPPFRVKKALIEEKKAPKEMTAKEMEQIYKHDLFGTFIKVERPITTKPLVSPVPQMQAVPVKKPPAEVKPEFLPILKIALKGIAFSSNEERSICIIEDETKKEQVYHVGDMIKDAQIIKIGQNSVTLLRANGQHEVFFLKKEDLAAPITTKTDWSDIVKKVDDNKFEVDIIRFPQSIPTLGSMSELLSLITVYAEGKPTGVQVGTVAPNSLGEALGLKSKDLITAINGLSTTEKKSRINIYDSIANAEKESTITVELTRENKPLKLSYKLTQIAIKRKKVFTVKEEDKIEKKAPEEKEKPKEPTQKEKLFKLSKLQERERNRRQFDKKHGPSQQNVIDEIRKRLLENIRARVRNARRR